MFTMGLKFQDEEEGKRFDDRELQPAKWRRLIQQNDTHHNGIQPNKQIGDCQQKTF